MDNDVRLEGGSMTHVVRIGDTIQQVNLYGEGGSLEINVPYGLTNRVAIHAARIEDKHFQTLDVPDRYWGEMNRSNLFDVFTEMSCGARSFIDAILEDRLITPIFMMDKRHSRSSKPRWRPIEQENGFLYWTQTKSRLIPNKADRATARKDSGAFLGNSGLANQVLGSKRQVAKALFAINCSGKIASIGKHSECLDKLLACISQKLLAGGLEQIFLTNEVR